MTTTYEVFTRQNAGDDLIHAGSVQAPNDRLARTNAINMYDEEDWDAMYVVASDELVAVTPGPDSEADAPEVIA